MTVEFGSQLPEQQEGTESSMQVEGGPDLSRHMDPSFTATGGKTEVEAESRWLERCSGGSNGDVF